MVPENMVATAESSQLAKDSSPTTVGDAPVSLLKDQYSIRAKAAGETNKELLNSCTSCTGLENITPVSSKYSDILSVESAANVLHESLAIEKTVIEDQIASPRDTSDEKSSYSTAANACNQSLDGSSFSLSTTITNLTDTPEKPPYAGVCNSEQDSSLNMSVNSYSQKRRIMYPQLSSCTQTGRLSCPDAGCLCQVNQVSSRNVSENTVQRSESPLADNCPGSKHQKPMQGPFAENSCGISAFLTDPSMEKKLRICCSICKSPLGIRENNFLVPCSLTSSSKAYLANALQPTPLSACLSESLPQCPRTHLPVLISDISSVDQRILDRCTNAGAPQHQDVWSEEDGCVFRTLTCPFCTAPKTLGVQVMATDASNVDLLNKVFFNADHVDMTYEQTPKQEATPLVCASVPSRGSTVIDIKKYAYNPQLKNLTKSKLRLPKRVRISSDHQDGDNT